ncbi:MAG: hypothetical protein AB7I35_01310 [Ramlibacter sp.]
MTAYVLPPVNLAGITAKTSRFGITDAMLISSSVPEAPPAAYNAGTPYAEGEEVSTGTVGGVISVWGSKDDGNTGNTPEEGVWWRFLGTTYAEYDTEVPYAEGAIVIVAATHTVYESLVGSNLGAAVSDTTKWLRRGATNRWAMFDMLAAAGTVDAVSPLTVVLAPGRISAVGMTGLDGNDVSGSMTADGEPDSEVVYPERTQAIDGTVIASWDDYFFAPFRLQDLVFWNDLPAYTDGRLTITLTSESGPVTLTKLIVGTATDMGRTQRAPEVRRSNFSVLDRAETSELVDISKRRFLRQVSQTTAVPKAQIRTVNQRLDDVLYSPCLWIGLDNLEDDYAYLVALLGLLTDARVSPSNQQLSDVSLEIEEV